MNSSRYTTDTSADAEMVQHELIRRIAPSQRVEKSLQLSSDLIRSAKAAIRRRHPEFTENEIAVEFIELHYGANLAAAVRARLKGTED